MFIAKRVAVSLDSSPRLAERLCAGELDPEAALIAAEESPADDLPTPPRSRRLRAVFEALAKTFLDEDAQRLLAASLLGSSQADLADYLGVTQQAVSIRLQRAVERLKWAATLETWRTTIPTLRTRLSPLLDSAETCAVETLWPARFSRSAAARELGVPISDVNRLLVAAKGRLTRAAPSFARDIARAQERRSYH